MNDDLQGEVIFSASVKNCILVLLNHHITGYGNKMLLIYNRQRWEDGFSADYTMPALFKELTDRISRITAMLQVQNNMLIFPNNPCREALFLNLFRGYHYGIELAEAVMID